MDMESWRNGALGWLSFSELGWLNYGISAQLLGNFIKAALWLSVISG